MRHIILTAAFVLACGSAMANSIQPMESLAAGGTSVSMVSRSCVDCPALKGVELIKRQYVVPVLKNGTQTTVVRQINGETKVVRTEAWLGGSPVVFISNATPEALAAADAPTDGIDATATAAVAPAPKPLDLAGFALRQ
jgi:hypothetical protein